MLPEPLYKLLDLNIDRYLNPLIPRNHLYVLCTPLSHFLGWRSSPAEEPPTLIQWLLTIPATVAGICVVGAVLNYGPALQSQNPPTMIASLGASAVLQYNAMRSPLAQPKNAIIGHTLAAIVGVGIAKLFLLAPGFFAQYPWVAAAVACACASVAMSATNTVHPPGGATAILACTTPQIVALGWLLPALILLSSVLMTGVGCIVDNTLRQYPLYWWTPEDVGSIWRGGRGSHAASKQDSLSLGSTGENNDVESGEGKEEHEEHEQMHRTSSITRTGSILTRLSSRRRSIERTTSITSGDMNQHDTLARVFSREIEFVEGSGMVQVGPYMLRMPAHVHLSDGEVEMLQRLMMRLRTHMEVN